MKKAVKFLLCVALFAIAVTAVACDGGKSSSEHTHEAAQEWTAGESTHWHECTAGDGEKMDEEAHAYTIPNKDATHHWTECICGAQSEHIAHAYTLSEYNTTYHWSECECGAATTQVKHTMHYVQGATTHNEACTDCDYALAEQPHVYDILRGNDTQHWDECECGATTEKQNHEYADKYDETCEGCGFNRDMIIVTYKDKDGSEVKTVRIGKGECADSVFVRYGIVSWTKEGQSDEFDLSYPLTQDTVLCEKDGSWQEHAHSYTWIAGAGEKEGYDIGTCVCEKETELLTALTPDAQQKNYLEIEDTEATVDLSVLPQGFTAQKILYNGVEISTRNDNDLQIDVSNISDGTNLGSDILLQVTAKDATDTEHTFTLPVVVVTKVIRSLEDFTVIQPQDDTNVIKGYYVLSGDINANGTRQTIGNSRYLTVGALNRGFRGTLNGLGYTVHNITVTGTGIIGYLGQGAVVENINFTGVALGSSAFAPLLARASVNFARIENVTATFISVYETTNAEQGLLLSRSMETSGGIQPLIKDVLLNAKGLRIPNVLGEQVQDVVFDNVKVFASEIGVLGYSDIGNTAFMQKDGIEVIVPQKVETLCVAEGNATTVTLMGDMFTANTTYTVICNGVTKEIAATADGLTLTLSDLNITNMGQYAVTVELDAEQSWAFTEVWYVTAVIREFADLAQLSNTANARNTGYYILEKNVNGAWGTIQGGSTTGWSQNSGFGGTFDGRGYTIDRFNVSGYGIFGCIGLGTVKNVCFDTITLNAGAPLLARTMYNATVENVSVKLNDFKSVSGECGILISRETSTNSIFRNITVDANNKAVYNVLGRGYNATTQIANFTVKNLAGVTYYGCSSGSDDTTPIAKPAGLTLYSDNGVTEITALPYPAA